LLLRNEKGKDRPICFYSKTLSKSQRNWSTVEKELYALTYGITESPYSWLLSLTHFVAEVDHRNLVFLDKLAESKPKLFHWKLRLMQFDFTIRHIPGSTNVVSDLLSRLGHKDDSSESVDILSLELDLGNHLVDSIQKAQKSHEGELKNSGYVQDPNDKMYRNTNNQIPIPEDARDLIHSLLASAHGNPLPGHFGIHRTMAALKAVGFTWKTLEQDVTEFVNNCIVCQKMSRKRREETITGLKTTIVDAPFFATAIDTVGPLPPDPQGNQYLLVMIDMFTRWIEIAPTTNVDAISAAEALIERIFLRHGLPACIQSDNGTQFINATIKELLERLRIRHHRVLPYSPRANGTVERSNQEVMGQLRCLTAAFGQRENWSKLVPIVQFLLNHTVHTSTGMTPYAMMYGRELNESSPPTQLLQINPASIFAKHPELDGASYVVSLGKRIEAIHQAAKACQAKSANLRMKKANQGVEETKFDLGELILLEPPIKPGKLSPTLLGPYKITFKDETKHTFKVQHIVNVEKEEVVHHDRLRKLHNNAMTVEQLRVYAAPDLREYLVEAVLEHRFTGPESLDTIEFLVKWLGYDDDENQWLPLVNIDKNKSLIDYIKAHTDLQPLFAGRSCYEIPRLNKKVSNKRNHASASRKKH